MMSLLHSALELLPLLVFAIAAVAALITRDQHPIKSWGVLAVCVLAVLSLGGATLFFLVVGLFELWQWLPEPAMRGISLLLNGFEAILLVAVAVLATRGGDA